MNEYIRQHRRMSQQHLIILAFFLITNSTIVISKSKDDSNQSESKTVSIAEKILSPTEFPRSSVSEKKNISLSVWECPSIKSTGFECSCDMPHTLRCTGDRNIFTAISYHLRHSSPGPISLLDITASGISVLPSKFLEDVVLHGLVISTGELNKVNENAFVSLTALQALGLPNNNLETVPTHALSKLQGLERLDLSHNILKTLESTSFEGFRNLTYLDLCDNMLSQLSPQAFSSLSKLKFLKMRGNRLGVAALSALRGLKILEELDLTANLLAESLGSKFLPPMTRLRYLSVSENQLNTVKRAALNGFKNLNTLILSHNQIDVIEDHAFEFLSSLNHLDVSNNRIVSVSSASLAHLENLKSLDLSHNFLRSLNGDLMIPLSNLEDLRLDDNDISMVTSDLPISKLKLNRLSLTDNPFNCDCTLIEFAHWLTNVSTVKEEDKLSAVCATPPVLENGVLTRISTGDLLCGEPSPPIMTKPPLATAQLTLSEFHYDQVTGVDLLWNVEPCAEHYTCDKLIIYETIHDNEIQIASLPIHCDSHVMADPCNLPVSIPPGIHLELYHRYRYCVVLMVPQAYDELSLGLGCSDVITLEDTYHLEPEENIQSIPEITDLRVNVSTNGLLMLEVVLTSEPTNDCEIDISIFTNEPVQNHKKKLNCSVGATSLSGLLPGRYRICASLYYDNLQKNINNNKLSARNSRDKMNNIKCVDVQTFKESIEYLLLALTGVCSIFVVIVFLIAKNLTNKRSNKENVPPQCFVPAQQVEITHKAHYIQLLATTKV